MSTHKRYRQGQILNLLAQVPVANQDALRRQLVRLSLIHISVYDREIRALAGMSVDAKIETFEDTGQIFLKNAKNATELPGVDLSKLTPAQKQVALKRMNSESCTCGCRLTLAQCRINDTACPTSRQIANKIVQEILSGKPSESPAKSDDDDSSTD